MLYTLVSFFRHAVANTGHHTLNATKTWQGQTLCWIHLHFSMWQTCRLDWSGKWRTFPLKLLWLENKPTCDKSNPHQNRWCMLDNTFATLGAAFANKDQICSLHIERNQLHGQLLHRHQFFHEASQPIPYFCAFGDLVNLTWACWRLGMDGCGSDYVRNLQVYQLRTGLVSFKLFHTWTLTQCFYVFPTHCAWKWKNSEAVFIQRGSGLKPRRPPTCRWMMQWRCFKDLTWMAMELWVLMNCESRLQAKNAGNQTVMSQCIVFFGENRGAILLHCSSLCTISL